MKPSTNLSPGNVGDFPPQNQHHVVEGEVEVIKITQVVQVLDLGNQVVLQVKNLKLRTKPREGLVDPLDVLLVE